MRADKKSSFKADKKSPGRGHKRGVVGYSKKTALLEEAITQMNAGKYGRSSAALKELLALDPNNMEARRLFATLHLRLGSLIPARQAFDSLIQEAFERQDYWLAESLLREYLAAGPRCVPYLEKLGWVFQEKGATLEAVAEYGKAVDILLEDPDPEHPQHAAELYAKIRELAPASPVAFRLANFFDAQTGQLIAQSTPAAEPPGVFPPTETPAVTEAPTAAPSLSDLPSDAPAGVMSAEPRPDEASFMSPLQPAGAVVVSSEQATALEEPGRHDTIFPDETSVVPLTEASGPGFSQMRPAEPVEAVPSSCSFSDDEAGSPHCAPQVETLESPFVVEPGAEKIFAESGSSAGAASASVPDQTGPSSTDFQATDSPLQDQEAPPRARLQEQVQEPAAMTEATEKSEMQVATMHDVTSPSAFHPATCAERDATLPPSIDEPSLTVEASAPSTPAEASGGSAREQSASDRFSWEAVFDGAWKFGDELLHGASACAAPPPPTVALSQSETPDTAGSTMAEVAAEETQPASSPPSSDIGCSPLPWDQVQDVPVLIPPASVEDRSAISIDEKAEEPVAESPLTSAIGSPAVSHAEANAASPTGARIESLPPSAAEPAFRLADAVHTPDAASAAPAAPNVTEALVHELEPEFRFAGSEPPPSAPPEPAMPMAADFMTNQPPSSPLKQGSEFMPVSAAVSPPDAVEGQPAPPTETVSVEAAPSFTVQDPQAMMDALAAPIAETMREIPALSSSATDAPAPSMEPPATASPTLERPIHWRTGELAVQPQRTAPKKGQRAKDDDRTPSVSPKEVAPVPERVAPCGDRPGLVVPEPPAGEPVSPPVPEKEEWVRTGESIRFIDPPTGHPETAQSGAQAEPWVAVPSPAAAAVDVLFESSGRFTKTATRERPAELRPRRRLGARLSRLRITLFIFIRSCFSTTQAVVTSIVALVVLCAALAAVAVGAIGLGWLILEEGPSPAFQRLTAEPQRTLFDPKKNGYLLLLGFDAAAGTDAVQAGYERKPDAADATMAAACIDADRAGTASGAAGSVAHGWFRSGDPAAQFKPHEDTIRTWAAQSEAALARYKQWLKLSFEDWGYGQSITPPCPSILLAHRLYVAEGFVLGAESGIDRLEVDMEAWRVALAQAKTLPVKMLALQAIRDDAAVASGLLVKPDLDGKTLARLTKLLRPMDPAELSIRWPMQSALVVEDKTYDTKLKAERLDDPPLYAAIAAALPLPKQRRLNNYAAYYEASSKVAGEGRFASMPKWRHYLRYPADSLADYLGNPIENIIGLDPLPAWDRYNGVVVDVDAYLRLASLQAWLRHGPPDADLLARIAKAGQNYYDPYTGLPMLVNLRKAVLYSVGHDGKDQDADPQLDVVVTIPGHAPPASAVAVRAGGSSSRAH